MTNITYQRRRALIIQRYGGKCACCGDASNPSVLQIDHINGEGNRHRAEIFPQTTDSWLVEHGFPEHIVQLLCPSCHRSKTKYGTCFIDHTAEAEIAQSLQASLENSDCEVMKPTRLMIRAQKITEEQPIVALSTRITPTAKHWLDQVAQHHGISLGAVIERLLITDTNRRHQEIVTELRQLLCQVEQTKEIMTRLGEMRLSQPLHTHPAIWSKVVGWIYRGIMRVRRNVI